MDQTGERFYGRNADADKATAGANAADAEAVPAEEKAADAIVAAEATTEKTAAAEDSYVVRVGMDAAQGFGCQSAAAEDGLIS